MNALSFKNVSVGFPAVASVFSIVDLLASIGSNTLLHSLDKPSSNVSAHICNNAILHCCKQLLLNAELYSITEDVDVDSGIEPPNLHLALALVARSLYSANTSSNLLAKSV